MAYTPSMKQRCRPLLRSTNDSWRGDEGCIKLSRFGKVRIRKGKYSFSIAYGAGVMSRCDRYEQDSSGQRFPGLKTKAIRFAACRGLPLTAFRSQFGQFKTSEEGEQKKQWGRRGVC